MGLNAALRLSSGRHKCRPYAAGCSPAILRQAIRAGARGECGIAAGRCATMPVGAPLVTPGAGTAQGVRGIARGGTRSVAGQSRYCDKPSTRVHGLNAALRRSSGRHKCRPYAAGCSFAALRRSSGRTHGAVCGVAAVIRATQVSPLRCGVLVRELRQAVAVNGRRFRRRGRS